MVPQENMVPQVGFIHLPAPMQMLRLWFPGDFCRFLSEPFPSLSETYMCFGGRTTTIGAGTQIRRLQESPSCIDSTCQSSL